MKSFVNLLLAIIILTTMGQTEAAIMATTGTFRGIYHENIAGVGRFEFGFVSYDDYYLVASNLRKQLMPYDGKYIELEVLAGYRGCNPGNATITKIGYVKELPPAPIEVSIQSIMPSLEDPAKLDVVFTIKNVSKNPLSISSSRVGFGGLTDQPVDNPDEVMPASGYTLRQLSFRGGWTQIDPLTTVSVSPSILLESGEVAPFVRHNLHLKPGKYELVASTLYYRGNEQIPVMSWKSLEIPLATNSRAIKTGMTIRSKVAVVGNRLLVEGWLLNTSNNPCHVFVKPIGDYFSLPGIVRVFDSEGDRFQWSGKFFESEIFQTPVGPPVDRAVRRLVDQKGIPFRLSVSKWDDFCDIQPRRIEIFILTEHGLEKLIVSEDLPRLDLMPVPPWGDEVDECRCRMRPMTNSFTPNQPIGFLFQICSTAGKAKMLKIKPGGMTVEIDGRKMAVSSTTLSDSPSSGFSRQWSFDISPSPPLAPGKHRIKLFLEGAGGTYTQPSSSGYGIQSPITWNILNGILASPWTDFEINSD